MACIQIGKYEISIVFFVDNGRHARVLNHLLYVYFRFIESSIYVKEERKSNLGELQ